ncbi:MAG: ribosome maturation factor RimP [Acidimicrobiia bacterium]
MGLVETVSDIAAPALEALGVELVDVEHKGQVVRVVVDEPGGIGLDRLGEVTQRLSRALDEADPISTRYTLEVSSPGVERPLRTPRHFQSVVGQKITCKHRGRTGAERLVGTLVAADDRAIELRVEPDKPSGEVEVRRLPYSELERARTVFEWGPPPKPGKGSKPGAQKAAAQRARRAGQPGAPSGQGGDEAGDNSESSTAGDVG